MPVIYEILSVRQVLEMQSICSSQRGVAGPFRFENWRICIRYVRAAGVISSVILCALSLLLKMYVLQPVSRIYYIPNKPTKLSTSKHSFMQIV